MGFKVLMDGMSIKMMSNMKDNSNTLVVTEEINDNNKVAITQRVIPIIKFSNEKWGQIPRIVIKEFNPKGYYLVAVPWRLRSPFEMNGNILEKGFECHVLHCVRKERENIQGCKFKGKVGPMSSFAPRIAPKNVKIRGFYVGYPWSGKESFEEISEDFSGKVIVRCRKTIDSTAKKSETNRRLGVIVGYDGYCVGMEVRLTQQEENEKRELIGRDYHHIRPIILSGGYYIFDGIFKWQPIHSHFKSPVDFPSDLESPLILLGEGIHLITSTKEKDSRTEEGYRRKVEICPSIESESVCILDWILFEKNFFK